MAFPRAAMADIRDLVRNVKKGRTSAGAFKHDFIVETQTEFGHTREIAFHLDGT
jgi:hypothetical protein